MPGDSDPVRLGCGPGACVLTSAADSDSGGLQPPGQNHRWFISLSLTKLPESSTAPLETKSVGKAQWQPSLARHEHEHE